MPTTLKHKVYYFALFCLVVLALILRFYQIDLPPTYMFDEDMHAFTALLITNNDKRAYEWWHPAFELDTVDNEFGISKNLFYRPPAIEWLHPPLTKLFQAGSIRILGNNSFAWRLPSALAGVGVIILVILIITQLTQSKVWGLGGGLLVTLDPFFRTQSQIASADIYVTLFTLLTIWLYLRYQKNTMQPKNQHQNFVVGDLSLLGVALGLTIASKWSGLFILPGLLLFDWLTHSHHTQSRERLVKDLSQFIKRWSIILLVAIFVYVFSFSQMFLQGKNLNHFVELHRQAWWYQNNTTFTHPYQSRPQEWLLGQKPVWYFYQKSLNEKIDRANNKSGVIEIIAQPNLIILWLGEIALLWMLTKVIIRHWQQKKYLNNSLLVVILFFSLWTPWLLIRRPLFIYHFLPSYVILILGLVISIKLKVKTHS